MAQHSAMRGTETIRKPEGARARVQTIVAPFFGGLLIVLAIIGLIAPAIKNPQPHDIPVGLVGPPQAVQQISGAFATKAPGAFQFTTYASEDAARVAIDGRSVDGALVLGAGGPRLIVAGAAGDAVTGVITGVFTNALKAQGATVNVVTVHPFTSGDPHGLILFFVVLAVLISTLAAQARLGLDANAGFAVRLIGVAVYGVLAALAGMAMATWIAGDYGSGFWVATALVALASAAVGAVVAGSARLFGAAGIGLAGLIVVLLDLVSSGGPLGSNLLPGFYRWLAPAMPVGQLYSAMRSALFFNSARLGVPIAVLGAWLAGGLLLMVLRELVRRRVPAGAVVRPVES